MAKKIQNNMMKFIDKYKKSGLIFLVIGIALFVFFNNTSITEGKMSITDTHKSLSETHIIKGDNNFMVGGCQVIISGKMIDVIDTILKKDTVFDLTDSDIRMSDTAHYFEIGSCTAQWTGKNLLN